ncbi:DUF4440 domain-containing protein [Croceitalea rosinachiae]|uniref:DUF4440 domain-containing protein n=1 Tax=Croceitalea rosinachiae TaxID=3075596 RepID=A0ABU3AEA9_9FLAO|nr:DUF4440 domain-containing protein [Croceitalea sp. F388]MDT0608253.1 DUF4440 domain-containing protein [Croceitalea sp. F388]
MKLNRNTWFLITTISLIISCGKENKSMRQAEIKSFETEEHKKKLHYLKEVLWPKAYSQQDTILLDKILDDSFELIDNNGNRSNKKDELVWIAKNAIKHDSFRYEIKRSDIYQNGTCVIAGTGHIYNDTVHNKYQSSNVLVYRDSIWKAILSHVSGFKKIKNGN